MAIEQTLSIIKPDAVAKDLIGAIYSRFEQAGLRIVAARMLHLTRDRAEGFYAVHRERPFFDELVDFMISGPIMIQILEGEDAVAAESGGDGRHQSGGGRTRNRACRLRLRDHRERGAWFGFTGGRRCGNRVLLRPGRGMSAHPLTRLPMKNLPTSPLHSSGSAGRSEQLGTSRREWERTLEKLGAAPYRAGQIMKWIYHRDVRDFENMTNLRKDLRAQLSLCFDARTPRFGYETISGDGTRKWRFDLDHRNSVESVYIPDPPRGTLCVSSQVGCALNCSFCATARQGSTGT